MSFTVFDFDKASRHITSPRDPGYIYLLRDRGRYKLGKTTTPTHRLRTARTWIPDIEVLAMKPFWFHRGAEYSIQVGLAMFHYMGEWYDFCGDEFEETFVEMIIEFSDIDPIENHYDFPYFMNSSGLAEFTLEQTGQRMSKKLFLKQESCR